MFVTDACTIRRIRGDIFCSKGENRWREVLWVILAYDMMFNDESQLRRSVRSKQESWLELSWSMFVSDMIIDVVCKWQHLVEER